MTAITAIWTAIHVTLTIVWTGPLDAFGYVFHLLATTAGIAAVSGLIIGGANAYMVWHLTRKAPR